MRNSIKTPQNRITQGTIFFGVRSPYRACGPCFGISITARCDTARDFKAPSLTFLPVVRMEEWLWFESLPKCIEEQKKSAISSIRSHLLRKFGTSVALDAFGVDAAFDAADQTDKGVIKQRTQYLEAEAAQSTKLFEWDKLPKTIAARIKADASQLIAGKNQNFHFIDKVVANYGTNEKKLECGHVAILRDIRAISRHLALRVVNGIDHHQLIDLNKKDPTTYQLEISDDELIYPTGELTSPFVEHLMQNFAMLFGRIGVTDAPDRYYQEIERIIGGSN